MKIVVNDDPEERLDLYVLKHCPDFSRSQIQNLIKAGHVLLNGRKAKSKELPRQGDEVILEIPEEKTRALIPQDLPLAILYEDEHLIVLNKAHGMVVHPAAGNPDGTVVNALLHHCRGQLAPLGGEDRPGVVHRLDKDTSGCLVVAKTDAACRSLVAQFKERTCEKRYLAVVQAPLVKPEDHVFTHIGRHPVSRQKMAVINPPSGKAAITEYETLFADKDGTSLILCYLHTGRTHQIRVHMVHAGAAILGDPIYAKPARQKRKVSRLLLHAWQLGIDHPATGERLHFTAPIPEEFEPWTTPATLPIDDE